MEASERLIQRSIENLKSHQESPLIQTELEQIKKFLGIEENFIVAINSSELLDLTIGIFVTSITLMVTISNMFSSLTNISSKTSATIFTFRITILLH